MATKDTAIAKFVDQIADAVAGKTKPEPKGPDGKLNMVNAEGKMLMCECEFPRTKGAPNPMCVTINDEIRWVPRGVKVKLPWYVVAHLLLLVQRQYRQEKQDGKNITIGEDVLAEPFSFQEINPKPGQHRVGERPPEPVEGEQAAEA